MIRKKLKDIRNKAGRKDSCIFFRDILRYIKVLQYNNMIKNLMKIIKLNLIN